METIVCPYCECKILVADVDDEQGLCPECGAMIAGALMLDEVDPIEGDDEESHLHAEEEHEDLDEDLDDLDD